LALAFGTLIVQVDVRTLLQSADTNHLYTAAPSFGVEDPIEKGSPSFVPSGGELKYQVHSKTANF
jgi:hypothetical protein